MYKLFGLSSLIFLVFTTLFSVLNASTFADFKRSRTASLQTYFDKKDELYNNHLQSEWEAYVAQEPTSLYIKQKSMNIEPAKFKQIEKIGPKIDIYVKQLNIADVNTSSSEISKKAVVFDFFGTEVEINIPDGMRKSSFSPPSQKGIKNFFDAIISTEYNLIINLVNEVSAELHLNDWGKYLLVKKISEKIFTSQDTSRLFEGFIFNKLGYLIKVGLVKKHIVVMYNSQKMIYSTPTYNISDKIYYLISSQVDGSSGTVFTYEGNYPDANKSLDLSMDTLPTLTSNVQTKVLSFKQYNKEYKISYKYNKNLIDFMSTYPQADNETFFNAPLEYESYKDIASGLRKHINAKQASVAINFVLNFVQNAFKYEVDSEQFGRQKTMFAQETLYYDKSDSEDRAVLFSYLIKELFDISVVGVKYSDHLSTALYIPMDGDSIKVNSKRFVIADPTYPNAIVGQSMPKYREKKAESFIYLLSNKR